jgi:DNA-binding NarL/FixJ family response regulator
METTRKGKPQGSQQVPRAPRPLLSYRQLQFLALQANGKTYDEIGQECFVAQQTVNLTLIAARERLGNVVSREVKNTIQAAMIAVSLELLALDADGNVTVPASNNYLYLNASGETLGRRTAA